MVRNDSIGVRDLSRVSVAGHGVKVSGVLTLLGWVGIPLWMPFLKVDGLTQVPGVHLNGVMVSGVLTGVRDPLWVIVVVACILVPVSWFLVLCGWVVDLPWLLPSVAVGLAWVPVA